MILYHIFISYIVLNYSMLNGLYGSIIYQTISNYLISCWDVHILYTYFKLYMICVRFNKIYLTGICNVMWLRVFLLSRCNYAYQWYQWLSNPTHPQDISGCRKHWSTQAMNIMNEYDFDSDSKLPHFSDVYRDQLLN